jgi:hypothetical protein
VRRLTFLAVALVSCTVGDPFAPTVDNVSGVYTAGRIVSADAAGVTDWMAAGGTLTLTLSSNGSLSGRLFLPGGGAGGGDLDANMAGSWLLIGHTVSFGQAAETFVRELDFLADKDRLAADRYFGDSLRVIVVLTK